MAEFEDLSDLSEHSHVSVMIDDALAWKVEKEEISQGQGKKEVALKSGLILNKDALKEVKIDKSLDRIFKGFCHNLRKFSNLEEKTPFDFSIEFLKNREDELAVQDIKF